MKKRGVTLIEILCVIAILVLLMALLLPVATSARRKSQETVCTSNMRQLVAALHKYREDYGDFPPFLQYVYPYVREKRLFLCPLDRWESIGGANWFGGANPYAMANKISSSYYYFADPIAVTGTEHGLLPEILPTVDSNHGVIACLLHGDCPSYCIDIPRPEAALCCRGLTLRGRLDGSVQRAQTAPRVYNSPTEGEIVVRDYWHLYTEAPCPPQICPQ